MIDGAEEDSPKWGLNMSETRWICSVTFLKNGKYPMAPVVHTIVATAPHVAASRAIATARREVMKGRKINELVVKIKRAAPLKEARNTA